LGAKLYPRAWRERYGREFDALLDETGSDGRIAVDVIAGAVGMQIQRWKKFLTAGISAMAALFFACWWMGQRTYMTPGTRQVFHEDSSAGALAAFLVFVAAAFTGMVALALYINDRGSRDAARVGRFSAGILVPYLAAVALVSLLTPRTIVTVGDSYCWDLWCMGIQQVSAIPQGQNTRYTAEVSIFSDSKHAHRVPAEFAKSFFYVLDEQGRRFPLLPDSSFADADVTVLPGEAVKSSLTFVAPATARKLYLIGENTGPPWMHLYFGSDAALLHRPTLLRVL
jgi:hypothetical protein